MAFYIDTEEKAKEVNFKFIKLLSCRRLLPCVEIYLYFIIYTLGTLFRKRNYMIVSAFDDKIIM